MRAIHATGAVLMALALLSGCGPTAKEGKEAAANTSGDSGLTYATNVSADALPPDFAKLPMKEFMGHVMQFAGQQVWKWQGYVNDAQGERSLFPKTDEEWEEAESGALTLAEVTNILLLPGRKIDNPKWDEAVAGVRAVALASAQAAEKHDKDALFEKGSELDEACENCHKQFMPNYQPPVAPAGNSAK